MSLPSHPTMSPQREALMSANAIRSDFLVALVDGIVTPTEVVHAAAQSSNAPLRGFTLEMILSAPPASTKASTRDCLRRLARTLEIDEDHATTPIRSAVRAMRRQGPRRLVR